MPVALEWDNDVNNTLRKLKAWNTSFGAVVSLDAQGGVEAVGAFGKVVAGLLILGGELVSRTTNLLSRWLIH